MNENVYYRVLITHISNTSITPERTWFDYDTRSEAEYQAASMQHYGFTGVGDAHYLPHTIISIRIQTRERGFLGAISNLFFDLFFGG